MAGLTQRLAARVREHPGRVAWSPGGEAREHGGGPIERLLASAELRQSRLKIERANLEQASPSGAVHGRLLTLAQRLSGFDEEAPAARIECFARGESQRASPAFELREFRRIAGALDRLADALARARANERRLAHSPIDLQESERRELARELHDEFVQSLPAIGVAAAFIEGHAAGAAPEAFAESARDVLGEPRAWRCKCAVCFAVRHGLVDMPAEVPC